MQLDEGAQQLRPLKPISMPRQACFPPSQQQLACAFGFQLFYQVKVLYHFNLKGNEYYLYYFMGFQSYCLFKPDGQFKLNKILSKFCASEGGISNFCNILQIIKLCFIIKYQLKTFLFYIYFYPVKRQYQSTASHNQDVAKI